MKTIHNISKLSQRRKFLRNNSTLQEIILWIRLKNSSLGYKFRRQHSIGGYIVDFYCPSKKLVIEIDGSQHYKEGDMGYDKTRSKFLESFGILVLRFSNTEINNDIENVLIKIKDKLISIS
jgi:very-short-patch-repair endonuclease